MRYTLPNLYDDVAKFNEELERIGSTWRLRVRWYSDVTWLYYGTVEDFKNYQVNMPLTHGSHRDCLIRVQQFMLNEYREKENQ